MKKTQINRGSFTTVKLQAKMSISLLVLILAVIGFSMTACQEEEEGGGTFTVTGIPPEHNGKYAMFLGRSGNVHFMGAQSHDTTTNDVTFVQIANGSVSLPMWTSNDDGETFARYSGNDTVGLSRLVIFDSAASNYLMHPFSARYNRAWTPIAFSNGSAAKTWNSGYSSAF